MADKPKIKESELDKLEKQFDAFNENVQQLTQDRMNEAPKLELEPQTKLSSSEIEKSKEIHLKPSRSIGSSQKFNERFREQWEYDKQYVQFIAENNECKGDMIEMWTRPYGGVPAEFWNVPVGKPIWGPRHLAEQIKRSSYHRLSMQNTTTNADGMGQYYGTLAVDSTIQRLDARPVSTRKSVFMGSRSF
jgi:hypothetical protein